MCPRAPFHVRGYPTIGEGGGVMTDAITPPSEPQNDITDARDETKDLLHSFLHSLFQERADFNSADVRFTKLS